MAKKVPKQDADVQRSVLLYPQFTLMCYIGITSALVYQRYTAFDKITWTAIIYSYELTLVKFRYHIPNMHVCVILYGI